MARCEKCNRGPQYGNSRPWSNKATRRRWDINVQKVTVQEGSRSVSKRLCTACIKTLAKA
ncbi:MAG: 50S ribosomal protein L28 [Chloroflexota bacterium]|nr:50S ribosomal protein L28 [Chloroflexota bacterium]